MFELVLPVQCQLEDSRQLKTCFETCVFDCSSLMTVINMTSFFNVLPVNGIAR